MSRPEVLIGVFIAVLFVEAVLLAFWSPWYYPHGIRVFRQMVRLSPAQLRTLVDLELEAYRDAGVLFPRLVFRHISERDLAFQEGASAFRVFGYAPIMRGLIRYDAERGGAAVTGILHWYPLVGLLTAVVAVWSEGLIAVVSVAGAIFLACLVVWAIQAERFGKVAAMLSELHAAA